MCFSPASPAHAAALRPLVVAALSSLWLTGCGGDGKDLATAAPASAAAASAVASAVASVSLQGCVVDALWLSAPGVAVHARGADGRAIGATFADSRGVFQITVPAHSRIVVDTAVAGPGGALADTGNTPLTVAACLTKEG